MIIDSHAHYNNNAYKKPFRYLTRNEDGYALTEGDQDQLDLAWRLKKPGILHVRDGHENARQILRLHPVRKLGGVIHCFYGSWEIAKQ